VAKETFDRSKPHVNIGTVSQIVTDTSGQLTLGGVGDELGGNPAPSTKLFFSAPGSGTPQSFAVAYPFDTDFVFDPAISGRGNSIDFQLDVLPTNVTGTANVQVTLAILQDEVYLATGSGDLVSQGGAWLTVGDTGLLARDFFEADGGPGQPDFGRVFQFGYAFMGDYASQGLDVELSVDNMNVGITTVPEPMSIAIMLILCGGALLCRRGLTPTMR
jgi:hypothetical protein